MIAPSASTVGEHAGADQLAADARADHLDAAVIDARPERLAHLLHRLHLRRVAAGLLRACGSARRTGLPNSLQR